MHDFLIRLKFVKIGDLLSSFKMLLALIVAPFYKMHRKHLWLVMERRTEARDNGYWFFRYLCEKHSEIDAVYVISPNAVDAQKVMSIGNTIAPGTLRHWVYYFAAQYNISSQKDGNPNAAVCFVLENYLKMNNHRIFLQHGVTKDDISGCTTKYPISRCSLVPHNESLSMSNPNWGILRLSQSWWASRVMTTCLHLMKQNAKFWSCLHGASG